jgi:hypothetical protein
MNSFADFFWYMIEFFFIFMLIWIFIAVFADIFRRHDLTGAWKVIWIIVIFIIPFFGALIYIIGRPKVEGDVAFGGGPAPVAAATANPASAASAADEITKLSGLLASGAITQAEFDAAKAKALA